MEHAGDLKYILGINICFKSNLFYIYTHVYVIVYPPSHVWLLLLNIFPHNGKGEIVSFKKHQSVGGGKE